MTLTLNTLSRSRRHLLGSTGTALAVMLAATAAPGQVATVQATGGRAVAHQQATPVGVTQAASDGGAATVIAGPIDRTTFASRDNVRTAGATSNQAALKIGPDTGSGGTFSGSTKLTVSASGVSAAGGSVIASRQDMGGATSRATSTGASIGLDAGAASDSTIAISGNTADVTATGNDASADIALVDGSAGNGGGIATMQTTSGSNVLASAHDRLGLATGPVTGSALAIGGNLVRAVATSNSMSNSLSTATTGTEVPTTPGYASVIIFDDAGSAALTGALGILSDQVAGGSVRAATGNGAPAYQSVLDGSVAGSTVSTDGNMLVAAGYGNMSANALDMEATSIGRAPGGEGASSGAVATVTGLQRIADGTTIAAATAGGAATDVTGDVTDSTLSVSRNVGRTIAAGNVASGNTLSVSAATIMAQAGSGGVDRLGSVVVGSGGARVNASFGIQNVQDYGDAAITATRTGTAAALTTDGSVSGSAVRADGNTELVGATGNDAANKAKVEAASVQATVAINSLQSGEGNVTATLGAADRRGGALIAAAGPIQGSHLSVSGNDMTGTAIGQNATNSLTVSAGTVADATDGAGGSSGAFPGSTQGAAGTFALASNQKLGQPSFGATMTPTISSTLLGAFGVTGTAPLSASSISVDDNKQRANALGNSAVNRMAVSAASTHGEGSSPGTALYASQFGQAQISASSDVLLALPDEQMSSSASLSRNANVALAVVNDVDNGVSVTGLAREVDSRGTVGTDETSVPRATGDVAVTNQQVAWGSADAVATTHIAAGGAFDGTRLSAADNVTSAEAAGNRALNSATATTGTGATSIGLANKQANYFATVSATATTEMMSSRAGSASIGSDMSFAGNTVSALARGNSVVNELTLAGGSSPMPASAGTTPPTLSATGTAALLNTQVNYGAVLATAAFMTPLNGQDAVRSSSISQSGNTVLASAYGNAVTTTVATAPGSAPSASLVSYQANYATVNAQATGSAYRVAGPMTGSSFAVAGNQLSAIATGNQARNMIGLPR